MPLKSPDTSHTTRTFLSSQYMYMCPYDVAFIYSIRHVRPERDETIKLLLTYSVHLDHGSGQWNSGGQTVKTTSGVNNKL